MPSKHKLSEELFVLPAFFVCVIMYLSLSSLKEGGDVLYAKVFNK